MDCLIVSATAHEIAPFLRHCRENKVLPPTDILVTGIGLTAATYSITRQISLKRPGMIIQAGIAGCFQKAIALGSVFSVKKEAIADLGVVEAGKSRTIFDLGLLSRDSTPYSKGWLVNKSDILKKITLRKVNAITVNQVSTEVKKIKSYQATFDPLLESMEGAALHYTCLMENIPFIQLRAVSNYIGERNKKNWDMKTAITNLNNELIRLLQKL